MFILATIRLKRLVTITAKIAAVAVITPVSSGVMSLISRVSKVGSLICLLLWFRLVWSSDFKSIGNLCRALN